MDDVNINEICCHVEEVEVNTEEEKWIKLSWINKQDDNNTISQSSDIQMNLDNDITQIRDSDNKVSCTSTESEDVSDGISVITDSDTEAVNTNFFQICQFDSNMWPLRTLETQANQQADMKNIIIACVLGIIIGLVFSHPFIIPEASPIPNGMDTESIKTASRNIVDTYKELTEVKTVLNEIKEHISVDKKIMKHFLVQLIKSSDSFNKINNKPVLDTIESFDSNPYPLDQLQVSLHVLSSLAFIYDNNSSLKSDMGKTLDIVNNTKVFYETLILFNNTHNDTQDVFNSVAFKLLQHHKDKIHMTSKLLLSNLIEKMNKIISNVYNKYAKERYKLIEKLCLLKNMLPDDKFLKQLTENNQLFKNYDEYCFSNYTSKKLNGKMITKEKHKTNNIKKQIKKVNNTVLHTKYDEKNIHKIESNRKSSLKNKRHKKHTDNSDMKFSQNVGDKIRNSSWSFLPNSVVEKIRQLKYQLNKRLHYLKSILSNSDKFFKQVIEDAEENGKKSVNLYKEEDDPLQSIKIQKDDVLKNSLDNILMELEHSCPLSTEYCPKFDNNMNTFDTIPNHTAEKDIVNSNKKHTHDDKNNRKTLLDQNSAKIPLVEGKSRLQQEDYFKSKESAKKIFNNEKINIKEKNISPQNKIKNHVPEHTTKSKQFSPNSRTTKQDNQHYINTDWQNNSKRFHAHKKQQQSSASDWYFKRAYSRRNARRYAEDLYQRNINWYLKKRILRRDY